LLEDRKKAQASDNQQRVMKNVNDLALMFSESMNQMQQQMAAMMSGQQMCTNPGGQKPNDGDSGVPMDKISEGQKNLNGEMKQMKDGIKEGGEGGTSMEYAQMAAKQAALRKALRDIQNLKQSQGQGSKELEEILEQMDKIETDLVNKRLTNEMLRRQEEILTRLLESERAEREKEYDNKRESRTAQSEDRTLPPSVEEYLKQREAQIEPFKTVSPALKPYYKQLVEEYYKSLKEN
jgi:chromosome segregation ATPase